MALGLLWQEYPGSFTDPHPPVNCLVNSGRGGGMITTRSLSPHPRASFAAQFRRTCIPPTPANMTAAVSSIRSPATSASCAALRSASPWAWPWTVRGGCGERQARWPGWGRVQIRPLPFRVPSGPTGQSGSAGRADGRMDVQDLGPCCPHPWGKERGFLSGFCTGAPVLTCLSPLQASERVG